MLALFGGIFLINLTLAAIFDNFDTSEESDSESDCEDDAIAADIPQAAGAGEPGT